ncbi:L,D-transpeptidase family protein [Rhodanobacter geophilus]|uniref:L,D-transpeptidase n=1 Tax=Rhodanobacter geophilus TaxID=3162488 RepID=A0ABV3QTA8_9GAMM
MRNRLIPLLIAGLVFAGNAAAANDPTGAWSNADQMVLVTVPDWNTIEGTLRTYQRDHGSAWHEVGKAWPVVIGRSGSAWGIGLNPARHGGPQKREGDGRSPAGVFRIGTAFGYAAHADTAMPYRALTATDYCMDVSGTPLYNRIADTAKVGAAALKGASEPMRRDLHFHGDQAYRIGFVIGHNPDGVPNGGSCIFAHLWSSPTTGTTGCTAMTPGTMQRLLEWLKPQAHPVFVLLPRDEYARLRRTWQLPAVRSSR